MAIFKRQQQQLKGKSMPSKRLVASYVLDWVVILAIASIGAGFWRTLPNHRPFSPTDPSLSFPYVSDAKVPTWLAFLLTIFVPLVITAILALILTPSSSHKTPGGSKTHTHTHKRTNPWRLRLWEWNTAWMGLAMALAITFMFSEGIKSLFGKPRPDLLARCQLDPATVERFTVGNGFGSALPEWNVLVSWTACTQTDDGVLANGFRSFPSGHAAFSGAGMLYLSLWLAAKFRVSFPHLSLPSSISSTGYTSSIRSQSAAPPAYLTALLLIPIAIGVYICGTVYSDFRHHGFDILFGGAMGSLFAYLSFRMYHAPITVGAGWAWGPRGNERPLWQGVGGSDWSGKERFEGEEEARCGDVEEGRSTTGSCLNGGNDVTRSR